jgi:cell wall-associated NlpC family hydrolase
MGLREDVVAYCRKAIGSTYDYTPSGGVEFQSYNCSYLSKCAFRAAGITIPGWQGHQNGDGSQSDWVYRNGHWTSDMSKLRPGDLVFFSDYGTRTNTGHVGVVSQSGSVPYIIDSTPSRGVVELKLPLGAGFVGGG